MRPRSQCWRARCRLGRSTLPRAKAGLAAFVSSMVMRGSEGFDFDAFNEEIEGVGASLMRERRRPQHGFRFYEPLGGFPAHGGASGRCAATPHLSRRTCGTRAQPQAGAHPRARTGHAGSGESAFLRGNVRRASLCRLGPRLCRHHLRTHSRGACRLPRGEIHAGWRRNRDHGRRADASAPST